MEKIILTLFFMSLISCQKEVKHEMEAENISNSKVKINTNTVTAAVVSTDTIFFYNEGKMVDDEFVLAHLIQKKYDKDSICDAFFKLDFIKNKSAFYTQKISIKGYDNGSDWYGNIEFDSITSPLKTIT